MGRASDRVMAMNKRDFLKGSAAMAATVAMDGVPALAETTVPRENWSGNYHYSTDKVLQPATVAEAQDAVRSVAGVRALGTRHSFNGIADSTVAQVSTLKMNDVRLDAAARMVTVGAGYAMATSRRRSTRKGLHCTI